MPAIRESFNRTVRPQGHVFYGWWMVAASSGIQVLGGALLQSATGAYIVLLGREFYMNGLRTLALGEGVEIVADSGGKAKTVFQMIGISLILLYETYVDPFGYVINFHRLGLALLYISVALSLFSAYAYTRGFITQLGRAAARDE